MLWPANHPYSWPTIGHMEDLTAASHDDVVQFFKTYYAPNNASLVDRRRHRLRPHARRWSRNGSARSRAAPTSSRSRRRPRSSPSVKRQTLTDQVALPRLYLAWLTPRLYRARRRGARRVSSVLTGGKNSRLYKRLVYDTQMAQDVTAFQESGRARQLVPDHRHRAARPHRRRDAEGDRRGARAAAAASRPTRAKCSARSTRSRRRSTGAWSAWAASAARPTS